jgi:hypothetical protein
LNESGNCLFVYSGNKGNVYTFTNTITGCGIHITLE